MGEVEDGGLMSSAREASSWQKKYIGIKNHGMVDLVEDFNTEPVYIICCFLICVEAPGQRPYRSQQANQN